MRICVRDGGDILGTQWRDKAESPTRRVTPLFCAKVILASEFKLYKFVKNKFLKTYFQRYRPFLVFLLKFFSVYAGLTFVYQSYLNRFDHTLAFEVDGFTKSVAGQVQRMLAFFNYNCQLQLHESQASIKLILNGVYVSRVVEGCNALSVIILFAAFVVAFSGKWVKTIAFLVIGSVLIHLMNVARIAILSVALLHYPKQESWLHGVVFPLIIYGFVFGLWVIWVNQFSNYARKD
ncbi:MAG: exosortase family protein XrtF [Flavobacterium sp.]|nr:exosortase family protein XrtF [Flavobacterium sp.]